MPSKSSLPTPETPTIPTMTAAEVYQTHLKEYPDVLNAPQVAEILGISVKTAYRLLNNGSIKRFKIGREFKVPKLYLLQYLKLLDRKDRID